MTSRHNYAMREGKQKGEGQKIFDCNCAIGRFCPRAHINNMATISVASECKSINSLLIGLFVFCLWKNVSQFYISLPPSPLRAISLARCTMSILYWYWPDVFARLLTKSVTWKCRRTLKWFAQHCHHFGGNKSNLITHADAALMCRRPLKCMHSKKWKLYSFNQWLIGRLNECDSRKKKNIRNSKKSFEEA